MFSLIFALLSISMVVSIEAKPNVLFIITDDMSEAPTQFLDLPNLKRLKESGTDYTHAYIQYPVCGPSRASIFTGRYPDSTMNYNFIQKVNNQMTIPKYFKEHGYQTISIGKNFHRPYVTLKNNTILDIYADHWTYKEKKRSAISYDSNGNSECGLLIYCKKPATKLTDYKSVSKAINILKNPEVSEGPWFMSVGFRRPHIDLANPKGLSYPEKIVLPNGTMLVGETNLNYFGYCDNLKTSNTRIGKKVQKILGTGNRKRPCDILKKHPSIVERFLREYYISYMWIDQQLGRLFNSIDFDNTIIVFTSDHGWNYGEHGFYCKNSLIDSTTHVPLVIKGPTGPTGPTGPKGPKVINELVEGIDIFPTIAKLAGLPDPKVDGVSVTNSGHRYAFSQYPRCRVRGSIQDHACMFSGCKLPKLKWMGYSVREYVNSGILSYSTWWPFKEERTCKRLDYVLETKTRAKYPWMEAGSSVDWKSEPVDKLFLKKGLVSDGGDNYIQVIRNQFETE